MSLLTHERIAREMSPGVTAEAPRTTRFRPSIRGGGSGGSSGPPYRLVSLTCPGEIVQGETVTIEATFRARRDGAPTGMNLRASPTDGRGVTQLGSDFITGGGKPGSVAPAAGDTFTAVYEVSGNDLSGIDGLGTYHLSFEDGDGNRYNTGASTGKCNVSVVEPAPARNPDRRSPRKRSTPPSPDQGTGQARGGLSTTGLLAAGGFIGLLLLVVLLG